MLSSADAIGRARPRLLILVEREERKTGSRMAAYENVAASIGRSASWVRKAVGRQEGIGLAHLVFEQIEHAYTRLCERLEADAAHDRAIVLALQRERKNAADTRDPGVDRMEDTQGIRKD